MKTKTSSIRAGFLVAVVGLLGVAPVLAIPSLQLYIDPDDNIGTGYSKETQTWYYQGEEQKFKLEAFALDHNLGSGQGYDAFEGEDTTGRLSIALRGPSVTAEDIKKLGSIEINGTVIDSWTFGARVPRAHLPGPGHEINTWSAVYTFDFGAFGAPVFDTRPVVESVVTKPGWHKELAINYAGLNPDFVTDVHFDVFTTRKDGSLYRANRETHDAEAAVPPVPEPATLALLSVGLAGFAFKKKPKVTA